MSMRKENVVMDEQTMIREQERLAREAKQKKTKKYKIILSTVLAVALIATIWYVGWGRSLFAQTAASTVIEIKKNANQEVVVAQIISIKGNEITYAIAEEVSVEETQRNEAEKSQDEMPERGMSFGGGEGRGQRGQGGMSFGDGEMPGRGQQFGGEMPNRGQQGRGTLTVGRSEINQFTYDNITYRISDKSVTTYIPVGTDVTTKLGTVTTFSRLAAGDYVVLVMDKDGDEQIIAAVYIVG